MAGENKAGSLAARIGFGGNPEAQRKKKKKRKDVMTQDDPGLQRMLRKEIKKRKGIPY